MASKKRTIPVDLQTGNGRASTGQATLVELDSADRMQRALKWLGILWGIAAASILIPLAHFILVPGFFIAGPIVALIIHGRVRLIEGGTAECPACHRPFDIVSGIEKWPMRDLCSHCREEVRITPAESVVPDSEPAQNLT